MNTTNVKQLKREGLPSSIKRTPKPY